MTRFITDPRWGTLGWGLSVATWWNSGSKFMLVVSAFFAGVAAYRWMKQL